MPNFGVCLEMQLMWHETSSDAHFHYDTYRVDAIE